MCKGSLKREPFLYVCLTLSLLTRCKDRALSYIKPVI